MPPPAAPAARSAFAAYARHVNPTLARFLALTGRDVHFVRAQGHQLTSREGRVYQDWIAGFGSLNLGHNPPGPLRALQAFAAQGAPNLFVEGLNPAAGRLAERLVGQAGEPFETAFFSNSGSEAVEAALKMAVAATGRREVVYCRGAYHGTTVGALGMMGRGHFREPFEPLLPRWTAIDFNDGDALAQAVAGREVACVVIEPVQVESGVQAATPAFLQQARRLCSEHGALLVFDEAQTGMGRTGSAFACQALGVMPDLLCLAKGLGCGLVPIGATLAARGLFTRAYGSYERCEAHNSTYGGNALACEVALAGAEELFSPALLAQVRACEQRLHALAAEHLLGHPLVRRFACHGLLGVLELAPADHPWLSWSALGLAGWEGQPNTGPLLVHRLFQRGVIVQPCGHDWNCIRLEPPLTIGTEHCDAFVAQLRSALDWIVDHG